MRAWLVACAALALALAATRAAAAATSRGARDHAAHHNHHPHPPPPDPATLDHIKSQILAKLGLSTRPTPLGAPPRDVVRQILARAADPRPPPPPQDEPSMREIIAIAHRGQWSVGTAL
ncbi:forkhead box protein B2-like [Pectinophora gossypiella]|uniref:forkhead box protein B2-like n=1 Tax=Pectinophora gossypiella TaxID=13191 RepID=UPI00214E20A7|nr:forkhead box protein B2-like [Pectinophora gossypiella]